MNLLKILDLDLVLSGFVTIADSLIAPQFIICSIALVDMLNAAKIAMSHVVNKTEELFYQDVLCQDAVVRRIEIIGEAARRISPDTQAKMTEIARNLEKLEMNDPAPRGGEFDP